MLGIREVDVTHQVQQVVIARVESEVLQQQLRAHDTHGVVIKTHADAIGDADQIGRIYVHLTIHLGLTGGATNGYTTLAIAL